MNSLFKGSGRVAILIASWCISPVVFAQLVFPSPKAPKAPTSDYLVYKPVAHEYPAYIQKQEIDGSWTTIADPQTRTYKASKEGDATYRVMYLQPRVGPDVEYYSAPLVVGKLKFESATACAECHPRQFFEWSTSTMAYGAISPTFNTLEHIGNSIKDAKGFDGRFSQDNGRNPVTAIFCQGCHTPIGLHQNEFVTYQENKDLNGGQPAASPAFMSDLAKEGVTCDVCHQMQSLMPDIANITIDDATFGKGGIANGILGLFDNSEDDIGIFSKKLGPLDPSELTAQANHTSFKSDFLTSGQFCGVCHDVRVSGTDAFTGENFRRLENLFTEWETSPWNDASHPDNPIGEVVACQGCHMSRFPDGPPNSFDQGLISNISTANRKISTHFFTGVDIPLVEFPGIDITRERRKDLLTAAVTVEVSVDEAARNQALLPVDVTLENVAAGHNIPAGFSQERQFWVWLDVRDANGQLIYESGYLRDSDGDGSLFDENLNNFKNMDELGSDLEVIGIKEAGYDLHEFYGDDINQRIFEGEEKKNLGLVNFGNEFIRTTFTPHEEVFSPFIATAMDNSYSLVPFVPETFRYDIPVSAELAASIVYPINVNVSLHYRPFPPRFISGLVKAAIEGNLDLPGMDETLRDKNEIVNMRTASTVVTGPSSVPGPTPTPEPEPEPEPEPPVTPVLAPNLLSSDGTLSGGQEGFVTFIVNGADSINFNAAAGTATVNVGAARANVFDVQLNHPMTVNAGRTYSICVVATTVGQGPGNQTRNISVDLDAGAPNFGSLLGGDVNLTVVRPNTELKATVTANASDATARVSINMGSSATNFVIDSIGVFAGTECGAY